MSVSVVLTGATGGIGEAIARRLVGRGDRVLLVARTSEAVGRMASELGRGAAAGAVDAVAVDVTSASGRAAIVAAATPRGCDVLINAAGIPSFGPLESLTDTHVESVVAVDLVGPILLTRALLPLLRRSPRAVVLNVGSAVGHVGLPGFAVYGAAKFGLRGFSEALRRELAGSGVTVRHLAPRATRTAFNDARVEAYNRATGTRSDAPERVARAAISMLDRGPAERVLGWREAVAARLNGLVPGWLDPAFRAHRAAVSAPTGRAAAVPLEVSE